MDGTLFPGNVIFQHTNSSASIVGYIHNNQTKGQRMMISGVDTSTETIMMSQENYMPYTSSDDDIMGRLNVSMKLPLPAAHSLHFALASKECIKARVCLKAAGIRLLCYSILQRNSKRLRWRMMHLIFPTPPGLFHGRISPYLVRDAAYEVEVDNLIPSQLDVMLLPKLVT